ncbi:hypothetical protein ACLB2K_072316 [Fragaria x ananassa]
MALKTVVASTASVTVSLISKLSLSNQEESVDLGNLRCPKSGFVAPRFYLVGCLNITHAIIFDAFKSAVHSMWRLPTSMEVQARGDRLLFTFSSERDVNRVKRGGPWAYQRAMIILNDYDGFSDIMSVPLDFVWIWVGIEGLLVALSTSPTTSKEICANSGSSGVLSPAKVAGVRRSREEETTLDGKRAHHMLTFAPLPLNPEELGFSVADGGVLGIKKTGKSPKKHGRGRPRESQTKKNLQLGECSDSMEPSLGENASVDSGLESEAEEE